MIDIDQDMSKLYQYHQHHPWALRRTSAPVDDSLQEVKDEEISIGEKVIVDSQPEKQESTTMKKASVALAGGSMIAVGFPLIPLPGPGCLVIAGGLTVLAKEFPAAQRILDRGTQKIQAFADGGSDLDEEDSDFVLIEHDEPPNNELNMKNVTRSIRNFTKEKILPLIEKDTKEESLCND